MYDNGLPSGDRECFDVGRAAGEWGARVRPRTSEVEEKPESGRCRVLPKVLCLAP